MLRERHASRPWLMKLFATMTSYCLRFLSWSWSRRQRRCLDASHVTCSMKCQPPLLWIQISCLESIENITSSQLVKAAMPIFPHGYPNLLRCRRPSPEPMTAMILPMAHAAIDADLDSIAWLPRAMSAPFFPSSISLGLQCSTRGHPPSFSRRHP